MTSNSKTVSLRLKTDVISKLDYLCSLNGLSRSQFISSCIRYEYDKISGNPELASLVADLRNLTVQINDYFSSVDSSSDSENE